MALTWPEKPTLIGKEIPRVDGLAKASGRAKYPSDEHPPGMLFAVMLYSPHAHAKVKAIDDSAAEKMPGVKSVILIAKEGSTLRHQGDDIAAVAAETEEQARDAVRAIKVEYEILPHLANEEQAMAEGAPEIFKGGNVRQGRSQTRGEPEAEMAKADAIVSATYSLPVITHVCLETHGLTARWDSPDKLTVWSSTQAVQPTAAELADAFEIPVANVTALTEVMGGGFGSKFGAEIWGQTAAKMAKETGRPVRLFLDRIQEHTASGNRPSATGTIRLGATKDGQIVAVTAETHGTGGVRGGSNFPFPYVYHIPNSSRTHSEVFINAGGARAMRAPGHPQGCALMEAAMDDMADLLGIDPIEFRLKNLDPDGFLTPIYETEVKRGAELIGWAEKRKPRGQSGDGPIRRGLGVALHTWGGGGTRDKKVSCSISPDGTVELKAGTQDLGTGIRTALALIAAEVLGLKTTDVIANIGNSTFPPGQPSGGSTTMPSMGPPCLDAATKARDALFAKIAPALGATPADLSLKDGQLHIQGRASISWKDACRKLGVATISEVGEYQEGLSSTGVGGCQFAEVTVDIETGVVRLKKIVAIQDTGLIVNRMAWDSQVYGGIIMGLNYGLFEERVMDPTTGTMLNPDLELYKLAGATDIPEIIIEAYEPDDQKARGIIGVGEPPTISTAAAIANAVTNAIGVRVHHWPMSPKNILDALAAASNDQEGKA